jgi:hypothetical protein
MLQIGLASFNGVDGFGIIVSAFRQAADAGARRGGRGMADHVLAPVNIIGCLDFMGLVVPFVAPQLKLFMEPRWSSTGCSLRRCRQACRNNN